MSIIANYVRVSSDNLAAIAADSAAFRALIEDAPKTDRHMDLDQFWDALAWILSESSRQKAVINYQWLLLAEGEIEEMPADASSIATDDFELVFKGGAEKLHPKVDFGYGPAAVLDNATLSRCVLPLADVTDEQLAAGFDAPSMMGVHPDGWQHSDSAVLAEVLVPTFHRFREFVSEASSAGDSLLIYFN